MWTSGVKNGAPVLRTVVGLRRSYATRKSQYDALVIGGGGFCSEVAKTANVENILQLTFSLSWDLRLCATCLNRAQCTRVVIIFISTNNDCKLFFLRRT